MADEKKKNKAQSESLTSKIKNWFHARYVEYFSEFKKIVWPSRDNLLKQTVTVIVISLIFGAYIALLDGAFGFGLTLFSQFAATLGG
ncbi:MAG: preprotein translocase subunit SecE [Clostridiales bacterium]|jgi:preprotein translocase subunit SecE|nr:preprotein translocase subunit SecE [Clostridiales bacterium]